MNVIRSAYVMKKILATFTLLAPLAGGLAQDKAEPAPNIVVKEPVYNFGEKDNNLSVEHTFEILNDGNVSLEISKTQTSCGCTVADLSQKVIPPGETATLKAVLSLKNKRGQQKKNITVHSNDPDTPTLQLILEGTATSLLTINPERVFMSGISQDEEVIRTVEIISKEKPLAIKGVKNELAQIDTDLETIREGHEYRLTIRTRPPLQVGRFQNQVYLEPEQPDQSRISILVMGDVVGPLAFAPQEIIIQSASADPITRYVVVRPGSQKEFTITHIDLPQETMESKLFPMGKNGYRVQLMNILPNDLLNGQNIIIHTDSEFMPRIEIPFRIQNRKPAA